MSWIKERIEEIKNVKSGKRELREYTLTVGIIYLIILAAAVFWKHKEITPNFFLGGIIFIILGLAFPLVYKPFQKIWMSSGIILGFFVSRLILLTLFYFVLTPIGFIARLFGQDVLDQRMDKSKNSYWHEKKEVFKSKESYENQY